MARIAITGGSGFIGRHLVPQLIADRHDIRIATRTRFSSNTEELTYFNIDLVTSTDADMRSFLDRCDILIHLAGEVSDEASMRKLHVDATNRLAAAAAAADIQHWIHFSSCGVYGPVRSGIVLENSPKAPVGEYETTKGEAENIVSKWGALHSKKVTIFRPSIIWSAAMPNNSLRALISAVRSRLFFFIGPPGSIYPCVHINDVVSVVPMAINRPDNGVAIFNLSDNIPMEVFIRAIAEVNAVKVPSIRVPEFFARIIASIARIIPALPLTHNRISALTARTEYCSDAARCRLGWQPRKNLNEGLREFLHADLIEVGTNEN